MIYISLQQIFERHSQSAPVNIECIIKDCGIELEKEKFDDDLAGHVQRVEPDKYRITVNKNHHYYRQRFTMAHLLAHFLCHRNLFGEGINDSKNYKISTEHEFYNPKIGNTQETEANRFAASVLMPKDLIAIMRLDGFDDAKIAERLQVSEQGLKIRLGV